MVAGLHEHAARGDAAALAHGQGFAASTSVTRREPCRDPGPGDHHLSRFERLAERVQHIAAKLGCLVQKQDPPVSERRGPGTDDTAPPPTMAAFVAV